MPRSPILILSFELRLLLYTDDSYWSDGKRLICSVISVSSNIYYGLLTAKFPPRPSISSLGRVLSFDVSCIVDKKLVYY